PNRAAARMPVAIRTTSRTGFMPMGLSPGWPCSPPHANTRYRTTMTIRLGVVMDPIESINPKKDSTLAMLLAAQQRGWDLLYMRREDLFLRDGRAHGHMREVTVNDNNHDWHSFPADPDDA